VPGLNYAACTQLLVKAACPRHFTRYRFSNCRHQTEPGCAVKAALADGSLTRAEWDSYIKQKRENAFAERKAAAVMRAATKRNGRTFS